mmetsp:Transcript_10363/g.20077  ORF Transcript_10363/g.20077 Transcript_10363/m.20077 type:complete len:120 (-) Transcript_10363:598-957(-)
MFRWNSFYWSSVDEEKAPNTQNHHPGYRQKLTTQRTRHSGGKEKPSGRARFVMRLQMKPSVGPLQNRGGEKHPKKNEDGYKTRCCAVRADASSRVSMQTESHGLIAGAAHSSPLSGTTC